MRAYHAQPLPHVSSTGQDNVFKGRWDFTWTVNLVQHLRGTIAFAVTAMHALVVLVVLATFLALSSSASGKPVFYMLMWSCRITIGITSYRLCMIIWALSSLCSRLFIHIIFSLFILSPGIVNAHSVVLVVASIHGYSHEEDSHIRGDQRKKKNKRLPLWCYLVRCLDWADSFAPL